MKYELEPDNRNCPDGELLEDLRIVASQFATNSLIKEQYNTHGRFCAATMQRRFGSWNKALALSGLTVQKRIDIPVGELLSDLKRVADSLERRTVTREQYRVHGHFGNATISRRFGSWGAALKAAGLKPTGWKPPATEEDLFDNMANVWEHVGRQPKHKDFRRPISRYSNTTYVNRFGSWRGALEAFVTAANAKREPGLTENTKPLPIKAKAQQQPAHRTGRDPSWRLRFLVMRHDNFACRLCGASPAKDPSVSLHVDHIHPWSEGGETVFSNLQTCCEPCNIGKSNLPMKEEEGGHPA